MSAEIGDLVFARFDDGRVSIIHADPRVLVATSVIDTLRRGGTIDSAASVTLDGDVLHIRADNRTVIYRIGEKPHNEYAYLAEWPD